MAEKPPGRRILLLRHGERVDRVFAGLVKEGWVDKSFTASVNVWKRLDVNMPRHLPLRSRDPSLNYDIGDYNFDVPLTAVGEGSAEALGYKTSFTQWKFTNVYSSPSLRCMQTVTRYLTGLSYGNVNINLLLPLKIDSGLFDFCGFNEYTWSGIPNFLQPEWMSKRGILMATTYVPSMTREQLAVNEDVKAFYARVERTMNHILKQNPASTGPKANPSILIATHAPFVDTAVQILLKKPHRDDERMKNVANYLKYIGTLALEEEAKDKWRLVPPPVRTFHYYTNERFQYKKIFKDAFPGAAEDDDEK